MRCLSLANALVPMGFDCLFLCSENAGSMSEVIARNGHKVELLQAEVSGLGDSMERLAKEFNWAHDARACKEALKNLDVDWLVVDHYGLDSRWEAEVMPKESQLLVIDDLADRPHASNILLDQNLGRSEKDYLNLLTRECKLLVGPTYALLRPDFQKKRDASLARRKNGDVKKLLVSMGGADPENSVSAILDTLSLMRLPTDLSVTVVVGFNAPNLEAIQRSVERMPVHTTIRSAVDDMASLMAESDLAIGASGGTSWERCCLGLPTLMLTVADNQFGAARALQLADAAFLLGDVRTEGWRESLRIGIEKCLQPEKVLQLSKNAAKVCDGAGVSRVIDFISQRMH
jgi:UDP-2,4-diacetamido-2,4,6-trideoxy-beta-L-altropyranose hydrolase